MSGFRAYFDFSNFSAAEGATITLSPEESRHLCGALRARNSDAVDAFDLAGNIFACRIVSASQSAAVLSVGGRIPQRANRARITLLQCLPKGKTFDDIIRQSVELGAAGIIPILSRFSQVKIEGADIQKKRAKWLAQVAEAVKQSSNFSGFDICGAKKFPEAIEAAEGFDLKIVASLEPNAVSIAEAFSGIAMPKKIAVLIGPEGDMSAEEYAMAARAGFVPLTLGQNVLKSETAAISALSRVLAALDFVGGAPK